MVSASSSGQAVTKVDVFADVKDSSREHRHAGLRKKMKDLGVILELHRGLFVKKGSTCTYYLAIF